MTYVVDWDKDKLESVGAKTTAAAMCREAGLARPATVYDEPTYDVPVWAWTLVWELWPYRGNPRNEQGHILADPTRQQRADIIERLKLGPDDPENRRVLAVHALRTGGPR